MYCNTKKMAEVKSYFDMHIHDDAYHKGSDFYLSLIENLKKQFKLDKKIKILDIGCGDGNFIKDMIKSNIDADFIGIDISLNMIDLAKDNIKCHSRVQLINADGFNLPLKSDHRFDIIHMDCVLHHLIGKTRSNSIGLCSQLLHMLTSRLSENGILIIEEWNYTSYFIPQLTSAIIFYGLKLLNFLHLSITKIISEIKPGLEVNFFHEKEIKKLLTSNGISIVIEKSTRWSIPRLYRCFLLKDLQFVYYMARVNKRTPAGPVECL
jgi:SAM-dependent methyltransferase